MRAPGLHYRRDLMSLTFANQIGNGGDVDENLDDRYTTVMIGTRQ